MLAMLPHVWLRWVVGDPLQGVLGVLYFPCYGPVGNGQFISLLPCRSAEEYHKGWPAYASYPSFD